MVIVRVMEWSWQIEISVIEWANEQQLNTSIAAFRHDEVNVRSFVHQERATAVSYRKDFR